MKKRKPLVKTKKNWIKKDKTIWNVFFTLNFKPFFKLLSVSYIGQTEN